MSDIESAPAGRNPGQDASHGARGRWLWAAGAGVITAVAVLVALPERSAPLALIGLAAGRDVRAADVHGGVRITYRAASGDAPGDALAQAARMLERRAAQIGATDVAVTDREITIEVAGVAPDAGEVVARTLSGQGELSFHRVVAGSPVMGALCARAQAEPDAPVSCEEDMWAHEIIGRVTDYFLAAPDLGALERFLARAAAADPALAAEPGHAFLFELVRPEPDIDARAPFWRTYYAEERPALGADHIADAYVYWEPDTNRPAVLVTFDEAGAARFHELTSTHVGGKIAIVLDGVVNSAPVIQDAISGGRVTITMGGSTSARVEDEAHALVAVLRSRTTRERLPVALAPVATAALASTVTRAEHVRAALLLALLAGLAALVLVRLSEHRAPRLDVALPGPAGPRPWGRLAVTVAALAAVYAGTSFVMLPGTDSLRTLIDTDGRPHDGQLSVFALSILPFVSAFLLVEIVALVVPRWRPLRVGGPAGRARLTRASVILGVLLALVQSYTMAHWLTDVMARDPMLALSFSPGLRTVAVLALTLTGGVLALWILAGLVSRHGLGNGVSVILLAGVASVPASLRSMSEGPPAGVEAGGHVALLAIAVCAIVAATSRVLRGRAGGPLGLRLPTCGIVPVVEADALLALPASIMGAMGAVGAMEATAQISGGIGIRLALAALLAVVFSLLFSRLGLTAPRVRAVDVGAAARRAQVFRLATAVSAVYVVGVAGLAWLLLRWSPGFALDAMQIAVFTAISMDLLSEWRARRRSPELVAVWPVHQVQMTDIAVRALQDAGISAHTRGRYHRSLLYFFGPFVPIEIMVPVGRADEAAALLGTVLGTGATGAAANEPRERSAAPADTGAAPPAAE